MNSQEKQAITFELEEYLGRFDKTTRKLIASLVNILGVGRFFVTNGASLYYRLAEIGIQRVPTDLDIVAPVSDLVIVQHQLHSLGIASVYDPNPVTKWDLTYSEPQLRGELDGIPFDLITRSTIIKPNGERLVQHLESSAPDWTRHKGVMIPLAPLTTVREAKRFQFRPQPKQDLLDLGYIELLLKDT